MRIEAHGVPKLDRGHRLLPSLGSGGGACRVIGDPPGQRRFVTRDSDVGEIAVPALDDGGCDLGQSGGSCTADSECCSGKCKGKPGSRICEWTAER